jgi:hypothetical protein
MSLNIHVWGEELARLRLWVGQIATEWALPASVILPCWEQHADIVQVLGSLRDAYDTLYHEQQPGTGSVDWQRYWSWGRGELVSLTGGLRCTTTEHYPERIQEWARDLGELAETGVVYQGESARVDAAIQRHLNRTVDHGTDVPMNVVFVDFTRGDR